MPTEPTYAFALQTCTTHVDGTKVNLVRGEAWPAGDPVVQAHPDLFSGTPPVLRRLHGADVVSERTDAPVERATAAPGERRTTQARGRKKAAAKKAASDTTDES